MSLSELTANKKQYSSALRKKYFSLSKFHCNIIVDIKDEKILEILEEAVKNLPANFIFLDSSKKDIKEIANNIVRVSKINKDLEIGLDAFVCDNEIESLKSYCEQAVVPIIIEDNYLSSILKEFNPMENTGNSYLYKENNPFSIFYAIIRYLENYKFPYDNRNLVKNVIEIH